MTYLTYNETDDSWVSTNQTGDETGFWGYDAFGNLSFGTATSPFGYSGQYQDGTTGLVNDRARWYQAQRGGFTTRDPMFRETDVAYLYTYDNPTQETDPSGLMPWFCFPGSFIHCYPTIFRWYSENVASNFFTNLTNLLSHSMVAASEVLFTLPSASTGRRYDVYNYVSDVATEYKIGYVSQGLNINNEIAFDIDVFAIYGGQAELGSQRYSGNWTPIRAINWIFLPQILIDTGMSAGLYDELFWATLLTNNRIRVSAYWNDEPVCGCGGGENLEW